MKKILPSVMSVVLGLSFALPLAPLSAAASESGTKEFSDKIYEDVFGFSWIKGFVTVSYSDGKITSSTTDSQMYGFHPSNSWKHSPSRSYVELNSDETGGRAYISGDHSYVVIVENIGTIATRERSGNFWFEI